MLESPEDRKVVRDALREISNSHTRIEAERDLIKEVVKDISDKYELPKKTVTRMAKVYHKQNFTQEQQENDEFEELYELITGKSAPG